MNASREQARLLLRKARDDAFMMRELMKNPRSPSWGIGFHAQQAVEKAIKAVLAAHQVTFLHTHDLKLLLNLLASRSMAPPLQEERILSLLPYAAMLRYDAFPENTQEVEFVRDEVEDTVKSVLAWAEAAAKKQGTKG